jgi:hypothetical protein
VPKCAGVLVMPVLEPRQLEGIAPGADLRKIRDCKDRG